MRVKTRWTQAWAGVVALAVAGLLAACATAQPGSAAVVGETKISQGTIGEQMAAINEVLGESAQQPSEILARGVVTQGVTQELVRQTADRLEVSVVPSSVDEAVNAETGRLGGAESLQRTAAQAFVTPTKIREFLETRLLFSALAERLAPAGSPDTKTQVAIQAIVETGDQAGVTVAPRYGEWSPAQLQIVPPADPVSQPEVVEANPFGQLQAPQ